MLTNYQVTIDNLRLPHLSWNRTFSATVTVAPEKSGDLGYGIIMGTEQMDLLGIDTSCTKKVITWGPDITVPMVYMGYWMDMKIQALLLDTGIESQQPSIMETLNEEIYKIFTNLDAIPAPTYTEAVYEKLNLIEVVNHDGTELTPDQRTQLLQVLTANEAAFQGCKGEYNGGAIGIILKSYLKPWRAKPYPAPLKNQEILEGELRRQCKIKAMRRLTPEEFEAREWAFPAFGILKKNGSIRLVIDFCQLNSELVRREYPLWTMEEILTSIRGFLYASSLDLNMGYLSVPLNDLTMGVMPATDIFQAQMVHVFTDMEDRCPYPYIDNILHFKGNAFKEHLSILNEILQLLIKCGMQVSQKSHFCQSSLEFLGFQLNRTGYKPLPSRVDTILRVKPPSNLKQVRGFLGVINFIKNHIPNHAAICDPITRLTRKGEKFVWDKEQQQAFDKVTAVIAESIMPTYPDPNRLFDIYPDASSKYAMGALLVQDGKVVGTFSRKFNEAQLKYTVTGQELLVVAEACKHFKQIIRGCEILIHTDHQNLTHNDTVHVNLQEQRTLIFLDHEFAPTFMHIKGNDNTGANGHS